MKVTRIQKYRMLSRFIMPFTFAHRKGSEKQKRRGKKNSQEICTFALYVAITYSNRFFKEIATFSIPVSYLWPENLDLPFQHALPLETLRQIRGYRTQN